MRTLLGIGLCLGTFLATGAEEPAGEAGWRAMARSDLQFVYETIGSQHPGPLDEENPYFAEWHERGYREGLAALEQVRSYGGYRAVLQRYGAGFRDGHLNIYLSLDYRQVGWPGMVLAWRDDAIRLHHREDDEGLPPVGARLVSCDGTAAETLFEERVLPFVGQAIPADRARLAPELFVDRVNPLIEDLVACRFEIEGETLDVELEWNWRRWHTLEPLVRRAALGDSRPFGIRSVEGNGTWITLPTFGPRGDDLDRMKKIMATLPERRDDSYVVIDVRRNSGGSSYWAEAFVRGLYGDAFYESREENDPDSFAVHRVSKENRDHFKNLEPRLREEAGEDSDFYRYFQALVVGMDRALEDGEGLYAHRFEFEDGDTAEPATGNAEPLFKGKAYFLTDAGCGSACLDFADTVLEIPGVVHVGQPTGADTLYMEVRSVRLPSNNGNLGFATKVWRNRERGHNEYYTPAHPWGGDIWDTPALESWIRDLHRTAKAATP